MFQVLLMGFMVITNNFISGIHLDSSKLTPPCHAGDDDDDDDDEDDTVSTITFSTIETNDSSVLEYNECDVCLRLWNIEEEGERCECICECNKPLRICQWLCTECDEARKGEEEEEDDNYCCICKLLCNQEDDAVEELLCECDCLCDKLYRICKCACCDLENDAHLTPLGGTTFPLTPSSKRKGS